jgi:hypothetical protein
VSSPREYRDHVTECLASAKAAKSDAERQIFLDMAKTWLETAVQAVIPTAPQQPAKPPPDDAVPAVSDFAAACANDNAAPIGETSVDGPTAADAPCENVAELPAAEAAAAATAVADPPGGEADDGHVSGNPAVTNASDGEQPTLQWNCVLEAALCPWGPSTSSYWPR